MAKNMEKQKLTTAKKVYSSNDLNKPATTYKYNASKKAYTDGQTYFKLNDDDKLVPTKIAKEDEE